MSLMKGPAPIRRTVEYLMKSNLVLKDRVKIFCINYNTGGDHHKGARDFVYWTLTQLQFKNPNVQVVTLPNLTPSPFISCFLGYKEFCGVCLFSGLADDGERIVVDIDSKSRIEIQDHVKKVLCKTDEQLRQIEILQEKKENPANFGFLCEKNCMCIIPGQVPCPSIVPLPYHMRGRFLNQQKFDDDMAKLADLEEKLEQGRND